MSGRPDETPAFDQMIFSHDDHVGFFELPCSDCHGDVADATSLDESFRPTEAACLDCHEREDNCGMCHTNVENRPVAWQVVPEERIDISHADHMALEAVNDDCTTCHSDGVTSTALPLTAPDHDTCMSCHNHEEDYAEARCGACHENFRGYPLTAVAEFDHGGDWIDRHGTMAANRDSACSQCHTESTCAECHSAVAPSVAANLFEHEVGRTVLHRGDWATTHSFEARANPSACLSCHTTQQTFCADCHDAVGVGTGSETPSSRHPAGWMTVGDPDFHGPPAQRDIVACASCHDQGAQSNCVTCHASGRVGGNPHPAGWNNRHDLDEVRSEPTCRACHAN